MEGLRQENSTHLLEFLQQSYSIFNGKIYKQVDEFTVVSPLVPTLANAFLVYFEKNWLQNCPSDFKPHYYRRYADDVIFLFTLAKHLEAFRNFINGRQC